MRFHAAHGLTPPAAIVGLLLSLLLHGTGQAEIARLLTPGIYEGDIAELVIEFDSAIPSLYPIDTSSLQADFQVIEIKSKSARMFEKGQVFHRMQWKIELLPRKRGLLSIPSLKVGDIDTSELQLEVWPTDAAIEADARVFIESEAYPLNPFIGQQVRQVTRLFHNTLLFRGKLLEPDIENVEIYRHGRELRYPVERGGERFDVIERHISLFPEQAGVMEIPPVLFRGSVATGDETQAQDSAQGLRRISRNSRAIALQVRAVPQGFDGTVWLPARQLSLTLDWDKAAPEVRVGDSLNLRVVIEAQGLPAERLPQDIAVFDSSTFRVYADQPLRSNQFDGDAISGRLEQTFVVLMTAGGMIEFPALELKWWNLDEAVTKSALTDSREFQVIDPLPLPGNRSAYSLIRESWPQWILLLLAMFVIASLLRNQTVRRFLQRNTSSLRSNLDCYRTLRNACLANDPYKTRLALIRWARNRWPHENIIGLKQIGIEMQSQELSAQLESLDTSLYSKPVSAWQGRRLWQLLRAQPGRVKHRALTSQQYLPELYPPG